MSESCTVCGSSATIVRYGNAYSSRPGETPLCVAHEAVCGAHLLDPCPTCDTE